MGFALVFPLLFIGQRSVFQHSSVLNPALNSLYLSQTPAHLLLQSNKHCLLVWGAKSLSPSLSLSVAWSHTLPSEPAAMFAKAPCLCGPGPELTTYKRLNKHEIQWPLCLCGSGQESFMWCKCVLCTLPVWRYVCVWLCTEIIAIGL